MELNRIYNEDCLKTMERMEDNSVDLVVTSPPYNKTGFRGGSKGHPNDFSADIDYESYNDNMEERKYWSWQNEIMNKIYNILSQKGSLLYNHKIRRHNRTAHHPLQEIDNKLNFYQQIIWNRMSSVDNNTNYLQPVTELILWFVKDNPKVFLYNVTHKKEVWSIKPDNKNNHPAPFPKKLVENCLLLCTNEDDLVYDPFMGSGTTAIACERLNRKWIGSEISEEYCKIANERIKIERDQTKLF